MNFEHAIIRVFLHHPELILQNNIEAVEFSDLTLSEALHTMKSIAISEMAVDAMVVAEKMKSPDALMILADIMHNASGVKENIGHYIDAVKEINLKKKLWQVLNDSIGQVDYSSVVDIVGGLTTNLAELSNKDVDHAYDGKGMMRKTLDHIDTMYELKHSGKMVGIPTGLKKLDKVLGGFHRSDLIIVGARPAMGKTAFAISSAINASKKGFKVGFISTEMSIVQVGMRVTSLISNISASVMRDSDFTEEDWPRLTTGTKRISELPFYIYDKPVCKVSDIAMQAKAWKANNGLDILFVDYLTRIKPESGSENKTIAIGNIATDLKTLARTLDIPVVCLAQVSRQVEQRQDKRPSMGDLRDSGVIEQEADQVLMLYRDCVYNSNDSNSNYAEIGIEKNRHGAVMGLDVQFKPETMEWCDQDGFPLCQNSFRLKKS